MRRFLSWRAAAWWGPPRTNGCSGSPPAERRTACPSWARRRTRARPPGADVFEEFDYADLYAPVDLDIGHCRLSVARIAGDETGEVGATHLRVATKYPNLTRRHFERRGIQAECVKLNGAMELAPSLGLARQIVDLVSTGTTLKQNGLVETSRIMDITARLIVNRAALKTDPRIAALVDAFRENAGHRERTARQSAAKDAA